jgi:pyruvate/2-oxoglutarate dehydrogenase complex dihydrolipoamide dehydrogenase (E3) component
MMLLLPEFGSIYKRLGVTLVERGESFYQPMMADIVTDLESKSKPITLIVILYPCLHFVC